MKGQNKTSGKELNEMEISNLSDAEFKTLVISMLQELIPEASLQQHKKDPGRNEGFTKRNKEKSMGN